MEQQNEKIREAVESFRQEMLDFWKDLINFQAGSKEKERMQTLMEKVSVYLQKLGLESELVESGAVPLIRAWSGPVSPSSSAAIWIRCSPTAATRKTPLPSRKERPMAPGSAT